MAVEVDEEGWRILRRAMVVLGGGGLPQGRLCARDIYRVREMEGDLRWAMKVEARGESCLSTWRCTECLDHSCVQKIVI